MIVVLLSIPLYNRVYSCDTFKKRDNMDGFAKILGSIYDDGGSAYQIMEVGK